MSLSAFLASTSCRGPPFLKKSDPPKNRTPPSRTSGVFGAIFCQLNGVAKGVQRRDCRGSIQRGALAQFANFCQLGRISERLKNEYKFLNSECYNVFYFSMSPDRGLLPIKKAPEFMVIRVLPSARKKGLRKTP